MKFGLRYCNTGPYVDPGVAIELVQAAEAAGFESAWTVEHTVVPAGYASAYPYADSGKMAGGVDDFPLPDPLIWLSYVASATRTLKLATGILILPQHNPVVIAKQVASLDHLSGGRVLFGIGVGWLKEEFEALGVPFDQRGRRTDEYVAALRALWMEEQPSFAGEFVAFEKAYCRPQPVQRPVPIVVGGHSPAAARRAGRLAEGFFPARGISTELVETARRAAAEHGRDPDALEITTSMPDDPAALEDYVKLGVDRVLVPVTGVTGLAVPINGPEDVQSWSDTIARYADA